jgi:hypothetical protein
MSSSNNNHDHNVNESQSQQGSLPSVNELACCMYLVHCHVSSYLCTLVGTVILKYGL